MSLTTKDLQAIGDLIDERINSALDSRVPTIVAAQLDISLPPILNREVPRIVKPIFRELLSELETRTSNAFTETQRQIGELQTDVRGIREDTKDLKIRMRRLEHRYDTLKS